MSGDNAIYYNIMVVRNDEWSSRGFPPLVVEFKIKQNTSMKKLKTTYSERSSLPINEMTFLFNGHRIKDSDTLVSLNMEDNAIINLQRALRCFIDDSRMAVLYNMEEMLESKTMTDFKIMCKGDIFECHKLILRARSHYFKTMLSNNMLENQNNQMEIKDMEPETLYGMIKFIYSGKWNISEEQLYQKDQGPAVAKVEDLLVAADRYDLPGLKLICEMFLISGLSAINALDRFRLANTHNAGKLREAAKKTVIDNASCRRRVRRFEWNEKLAGDPDLFRELSEAWQIWQCTMNKALKSTKN